MPLSLIIGYQGREKVDQHKGSPRKEKGKKFGIPEKATRSQKWKEKIPHFSLSLSRRCKSFWNIVCAYNLRKGWRLVSSSHTHTHTYARTQHLTFGNASFFLRAIQHSITISKELWSYFPLVWNFYWHALRAFSILVEAFCERFSTVSTIRLCLRGTARLSMGGRHPCIIPQFSPKFQINLSRRIPLEKKREPSVRSMHGPLSPFFARRSALGLRCRANLQRPGSRRMVHKAHL